MEVVVGVSVPVDGGVFRRVRLLRCLGVGWVEFGFFRGVDFSSGFVSCLRDVVSRFGLRCSVHAPYFVNFCSERLIVRERSLNIVLKCLDVACMLGCEYVVVHVGYYGSYGPSRCFSIVRDYFMRIAENVREKGARCRIAVETMARDCQFGSIEDVVRLCREIGLDVVVPCIDWAHIYVRYRGSLSFSMVLNYVCNNLPGLDRLHCHYTSVHDFEDYHVPVGEGPPDFREVLDALRSCSSFREVSIICESPRPERDALKLAKMVRDYS